MASAVVRADCKSLADWTAHHTPSAADPPGCRGASLWSLFFVSFDLYICHLLMVIWRFGVVSHAPSMLPNTFSVTTFR